MSKKVLSLLIVLSIITSIPALKNKKNQRDELKDNQHQPTEKTTSTKNKGYEKIPDVRTTDWNLILVNSTHPIETDKVNLVPMPDGHEIEARVLPAYETFNEEAKKAGFSLVIVSAYRSVAYQEEVFNKDYQNKIYQGMSATEAKKDTSAYILTPGTSEHHTGLALDVVDKVWYNRTQQLEEEFGATDAGKWIDENACRHGFIIRYPKGKEGITKINYEPWHLRYVGKENAQYIKEHRLTLEEYIELLEKAGK